MVAFRPISPVVKNAFVDKNPCMEPITIIVLSTHVIDGQVRAIVRADAPPASADSLEVHVSTHPSYRHLGGRTRDRSTVS